MRKIFTLIISLFVTVAAMADALHVTTNTEFNQAMSAEGEAEIIVDADLTFPSTMKGKKVVDANGHTITLEYQTSVTDLTIKGNGIFVSGATYRQYYFTIGSGAKMAIDNGEFIDLRTGVAIIGLDGDDSGNLSLTFNGGLFKSKKIVHNQYQGTGNCTITYNGGVFMNDHDYLSVYDDSGYAHANVVLNKCVMFTKNASKIFYLYSTDATSTVTIPAGKTYVIDGSYNSNIAEAKNARELAGKVLYVGDNSDFSLFNLMGNSNASTNVFNQKTGGGAYGHQAHSAVFVTATPDAGYAKVSFTAPADAKVYDLGSNNYCIMPYTPGMTVSAKGEKVVVDEIAITTKAGCIPDVGQNFWSRKTNMTECKTMISWPASIYVSSLFWRNKANDAMCESSVVCEAGLNYELYFKYYLNDGYELADEVTVTVDGKAARHSKSYKEIYFDYSPVTSDINATTTEKNNAKYIENGRLVIERNGKKYNAVGAQL